MPYVIEVRIAAHAPAQNDGVEGTFVDLLQERLPFHDPDVCVDAGLLEVLLDDLGCVDAFVVSLVGQDGEPEGPSLFVHDAVSVRVLPSGLGKQTAGLFKIVGVAFGIRVICPGDVRERAGAGPAESQEDAVDDAPAVDGVCQGLPDLFVHEKLIGQVVSKIGEGVRRVPELAVVLTDPPRFAFSQVLDRVQAHQIHAAREKLLEHGGTVRDDPVDELVDVGPALEILAIRFEHKLLARVPFLEFKGSGPDGVPVERVRIDVLAFEQVLGDHAHAPAFECRGERLPVSHPEGISVYDLGLPDVHIGAAVRRGYLRIDKPLIREEAVFGSELDPVMPLCSFPKVKGDGLSVRRDVPPLREIADELDVLVILHEAVEDLVVDGSR